MPDDADLRHFFNVGRIECSLFIQKYQQYYFSQLIYSFQKIQFFMLT